MNLAVQVTSVSHGFLLSTDVAHVPARLRFRGPDVLVSAPVLHHCDEHWPVGSTRDAHVQVLYSEASPGARRLPGHTHVRRSHSPPATPGNHRRAWGPGSLCAPLPLPTPAPTPCGSGPPPACSSAAPPPVEAGSVPLGPVQTVPARGQGLSLGPSSGSRGRLSLSCACQEAGPFFSTPRPRSATLCSLTQVGQRSLQAPSISHGG